MPAPVRTCIGCRERAPKATLARIVWDDSLGQVVLDPPQNHPGRGAYLHPRTVCAAQAHKRRSATRALRRHGADLTAVVAAVERGQ